MPTNYVVSMDTRNDGLETVGGKGRSLSRMLNAGLEVPGGFILSADAYRSFVHDNDLRSRILALAVPSIIDGTASFEPASDAISQLFAEHEMSPEMAAEISSAYGALGDNPAVAVRSSANAEDLPDLSFAGQQETYLNVQGREAVASAVRNCWASLWTAQAINYRHEMDVGQDLVAMAVVVQIMVPSEVSGILFTANPSNGERTEIIINCSFGLGEAVVSGQVTPDTYVVDRDSLDARETIIGAKELMIVSDGDQGTRMMDVAEDQRDTSSLSTDAVRELASLAVSVEGHCDGVPQDIEWAISEGKLWLLQARPITNLPPPPPNDVTWPEIPDAQLLKRQVTENMPDPLSPLFEDMYMRAIFESQKWPEGWEYQGRLTRNWMKNFVVTTVNGYAYQPIYTQNASEWKNYMGKHRKEQTKLPWYKLLKRAVLMGDYMIEDMKGGPLHPLYLVTRMFRTFKRYPTLQYWEDKQLPDYLAVINRWQALDPTQATGEELLMAMRSLTDADAQYWHALRAVIGTAKATDGGFQMFLEKNAPDAGLISGSFLSGFASKTLDAEVAMRVIADGIRRNPALYELTIVTPAPRLLDALKAHSEGKPTHELIDGYLHDFGRQVFNLDFVEPSLEEAPLPFAMSLKALVRDTGRDLADRQREVAKARRKSFVKALKVLKGKKRFEFLRTYWTARINYPTREEALFYMGLAWSVFRPWAQELGRRLVDIGTLGTSDDVYYLTSDDLRAAIDARANDRAMPELMTRAAAQRDLRALRFRMVQPPAIPPLKEDQGPYSTIRNNDEGENVLRGFAVSPGTVTGVASVILMPNDFDKMKPNSILVCPLTTPAWTQLFPHATGLVTDIGSILAHGSIVAREYGIPAVLGIGDVTQRVKSGQKISVDGDRGTVTILE